MSQSFGLQGNQTEENNSANMFSVYELLSLIHIKLTTFLLGSYFTVKQFDNVVITFLKAVKMEGILFITSKDVSFG